MLIHSSVHIYIYIENYSYLLFRVTGLLHVFIHISDLLLTNIINEQFRRTCFGARKFLSPRPVSLDVFVKLFVKVFVKVFVDVFVKLFVKMLVKVLVNYI